MITVTVVSMSKYSLENDKCYLNTFVNFFLSIQDKLSLEGIVVQRAECRPAANENYMRLKRLVFLTLKRYLVCVFCLFRIEIHILDCLLTT